MIEDTWTAAVLEYDSNFRFLLDHAEVPGQPQVHEGVRVPANEDRAVCDLQDLRAVHRRILLDPVRVSALLQVVGGVQEPVLPRPHRRPADDLRVEAAHPQRAVQRLPIGPKAQHRCLSRRENGRRQDAPEKQLTKIR